MRDGINAVKNALLAPNHRLLLYVAAGIAVFILIAVVRAVSSRREVSFSLNSPVANSIRPIEGTSAPVDRPSSVDRSFGAARCTHCGVSMSARQDFCPSCGYAQPMQKTGTANLRG